MTSKHGARAIHYEFHQLYHFSACTGIISVDPTHVTQKRGIFGITNPHQTLQDIYPITNLHRTLQDLSPIINPHLRLQRVEPNSQTNQKIDIYFTVKLTQHENVREYHDYRIDF
jgi:hypothetical protein